MKLENKKSQDLWHPFLSSKITLKATDCWKNTDSVKICRDRTILSSVWDPSPMDPRVDASSSSKHSQLVLALLLQMLTAFRRWRFSSQLFLSLSQRRLSSQSPSSRTISPSSLRENRGWAKRSPCSPVHGSVCKLIVPTFFDGAEDFIRNALSLCFVLCIVEVVFGLGFQLWLQLLQFLFFENLLLLLFVCLPSRKFLNPTKDEYF